MIAIAANRYGYIEDMIKSVPLNNAGSDVLQVHADEPYSIEAIIKYTDGCFLQNMNHKLEGGPSGSIYERILADPIGSFDKTKIKA